MDDLCDDFCELCEEVCEELFEESCEELLDDWEEVVVGVELCIDMFGWFVLVEVLSEKICCRWVWMVGVLVEVMICSDWMLWVSMTLMSCLILRKSCFGAVMMRELLGLWMVIVIWGF